jgi:hypothetical protein
MLYNKVVSINNKGWLIMSKKSKRKMIRKKKIRKKMRERESGSVSAGFGFSGMGRFGNDDGGYNMMTNKVDFKVQGYTISGRPDEFAEIGIAAGESKASSFVNKIGKSKANPANWF